MMTTKWRSTFCYETG